MKRIMFLGLIAIMLHLISINTNAQTDTDDSDEQYARANIGYTSFMKLGISESKYAKCVRSQNYLEPDKLTRVVVINEEKYQDDGQNFDRVANDGILTSTQSYEYSKGSTIIAPGQYRLLNTDFFCDPAFQHQSKVLANKLKIKIGCKFDWVKCSAWPPEYQRICRQLTWPFNGSFELKSCEIEITNE